MISKSSTAMDSIFKLRSKLKHEYYRFRSYVGRPKIVTNTKPVILSESNQCSKPIFLNGVHRSGTSLCRRIINSHSQIACPPETYFLEHFASMIRDKNTFAGLEGIGYDYPTALKEIRNWSSRYHEAYRLSQGKLRWADKTPHYINILPEIEQLFGDDAQYIMIFRNPLDVIYSIFKRGWNFSSYDSEPLKNTAFYVTESLEKQLNFAQQHPNRCFDLFYENLIKKPEETLKNMFQFLGETWEPDVLNYLKFEHCLVTEEPIVRVTTGLTPNFDNWQAFSSEQLSSILPIVEDVMKELGYSLDNSKFPSYTKSV